VDIIETFPKSVKSFGDFEDILAKGKPDVWESHRPAEGGAAGKMLKDIIAKAANLKAAAPAKQATATQGSHVRPSGTTALRLTTRNPCSTASR